MTEWLTQNESIARLTAFIITLLVMLILERLLPNRHWQPCPAEPSLVKRQLLNLSLTAINTIALRLLPIASAAATSIWANDNSFGLFPLLEISMSAQFVLSIILLDLCIYWQHRYFHHNPFLWNLHKVHHCDTHLDTSTALRFHPLEIIISMLIKCIIVGLLGLPLAGLIAFEIILNASALFNHGNIKLASPLDAAMRRLIVTPDMHSVHHSVAKQETNSNYGFFLSIWDQIFSSYKKESASKPIKIGISELDNKQVNSITKLIRLPIEK